MGTWTYGKINMSCSKDRLAKRHITFGFILVYKLYHFDFFLSIHLIPWIFKILTCCIPFSFHFFFFFFRLHDVLYSMKFKHDTNKNLSIQRNRMTHLSFRGLVLASDYHKVNFTSLEQFIHTYWQELHFDEQQDLQNYAQIKFLCL